ncbi:MAG: hypothetical protein ACE5FV_10895 [Woeseia sp.]
MGTSQRKATQNYRRRLKEQGLRRVEVEVSESDASLIRRLAKLLRDRGEAADRIRKELTALIRPGSEGLKALLAAAPLEGVRIRRSRDTGRVSDL